MGDLFTRTFTLNALREAWDGVLSADLSDGTLSAGVTRFRDDADTRLTELYEQLRTGTYHPLPLVVVPVPKPDGGTRELRVPPVRDRIVERAAAAGLTGLVDPLLGPSSFAYRPGLGVADAIQALARLRDEGHGWVLRADVDDCFPSVDLTRLGRTLDVVVADTELRALLARFLSRPALTRTGRTPAQGLPQGSPLSPMLANLVLEHLDDRLRRAGFPVVRYADDLAVPAHTEQDAWEAARTASTALEEIDMRLGGDDTDVMSFETGFTFLGEDFGPRYPPVVAEHRTVEPPRRCVYLGMQGSRARADGGRLIVESPDDTELLDVPLGHVERVVCFGAVGISAGLRSWSLGNGVDIALLSRRGSYLGEIRSAAGGRRVARLRAQLTAGTTEEIWLPFARAAVDGKLRKQLVLVQRLSRRGETTDRTGTAVAQLRQLIAMLPEATDRAELMGLEGAGAKAYFGALSALVPPDLTFSGRSRRPPMDVVNAGLSFGYALLLAEAVSAVVAAGLEPAAGLLHTDHETRPSLALDIMEEFRPLVVDQVVMAAARRGELRPEHGRSDDDRPGVLLTKAGREVVIGGYERRMLHTTRGALPGFSGSLRRHLYRQAQRVATMIDGGHSDWTGLSWR